VRQFALLLLFILPSWGCHTAQSIVKHSNRQTTMGIKHFPPLTHKELTTSATHQNTAHITSFALSQQPYSPLVADHQSIAFVVEGFTPCSRALMSRLWDLGHWKAPITFFIDPHELIRNPHNLDLKNLIVRVQREGHQIALRVTPQRYKSWLKNDLSTRASLSKNSSLPIHRKISLQAIRWNRFIQQETVLLATYISKFTSRQSQPLSLVWSVPSTWITQQPEAMLKQLNTIPVTWHQRVHFDQKYLSSLHIKDLKFSKQMADQFTIQSGSIVHISQKQYMFKGKSQCPVNTWLKQLKPRLENKKISLRTLDQALPKLSVSNSGLRLIALHHEAPSLGCTQIFSQSNVPGDWVGYDRNHTTQSSKALRWALVLKTLYHDNNSALDRYMVLPMHSKITDQSQLPTLKNSSELAVMWQQRHLWWQIPHCWKTVSAKQIQAPFSWHAKQSSPTWWQVFTGDSKELSNTSSIPSKSKLNQNQDSLFKDKENQWRTRHLSLPLSEAAHGRFQIPSLYQLITQEKQYKLPLKVSAILNEVFTQYKKNYVSYMQSQHTILYWLDKELDWETWQLHPNKQQRVQESIAARMLVSAFPLIPYQVLAEASHEQKPYALSYAGRTHIGPMIYIHTDRTKDAWIPLDYSSQLLGYQWDNLADVTLMIHYLLKKHKHLKAGDVISQMTNALPRVTFAKRDQYIYDQPRAYLKSVIHTHVNQGMPSIPESSIFKIKSYLLGRQQIQFVLPNSVRNQ
jgi:hypothetical protein